MTLYLDTSLLVASLTREAKTAQVQAWLGGQQLSDLCISEWVITEFSGIRAQMGPVCGPVTDRLS